MDAKNKYNYNNRDFTRVEVIFLLHIPDDTPHWSDEYKLLTQKQLNIPALHMIGHADFHTTFEKLDTHYHCHMEFVVIINGKQRYVVNDKYYMLYGGDVFMTYPYENHGNGDLPQDICEFIWFQLDLSSPRNFLGLSSPYSDYLFRQMLNYHCRTRRVSKRDLSLLQEAFKYLSSDAPREHLHGYSCFLHFFMNAICTSDHPSSASSYSSDIQEAISYIHTHVLENPSIEQIASFCSLSPSRFKAKFKEELGITPHSYITALKIDTAKILLKDPANSVTDVAYQLNFTSSNHFASVFKKQTLYTPSDFRKLRFSIIY